MNWFCLFIYFLCNCFCIFQTEASTSKYVIGSTTWGLFIEFISVINHLDYSEKHSKTPVVYWGPKSSYYEKGYHPSENVWEYFFEPVSKLSIADIKSTDVLYNNYAHFANLKPRSDFEEPTRKRAHNLISKYIRIKPSIQKKIDQFYIENMKGKKTIGIHCRGTDRHLLLDVCPIQKIITEANQLCDNDTQFLIATDDQRLFDFLKKNLHGKVIYYEAFRSTATSNEWWRKESNRPRLGEDVLIEASLLSRSNYFLFATPSSVATCVLYLNPNLQFRHIHYGKATQLCKCSSNVSR